MVMSRRPNGHIRHIFGDDPRPDEATKREIERDSALNRALVGDILTQLARMGLMSTTRLVQEPEPEQVIDRNIDLFQAIIEFGEDSRTIREQPSRPWFADKEGIPIVSAASFYSAHSKWVNRGAEHRSVKQTRIDMLLGGEDISTLHARRVFIYRMREAERGEKSIMSKFGLVPLQRFHESDILEPTRLPSKKQERNYANLEATKTAIFAQESYRALEDFEAELLKGNTGEHVTILVDMHSIVSPKYENPEWYISETSLLFALQAMQERLNALNLPVSIIAMQRETNPMFLENCVSGFTLYRPTHEIAAGCARGVIEYLEEKRGHNLLFSTPRDCFWKVVNPNKNASLPAIEVQHSLKLVAYLDILHTVINYIDAKQFG